MDIVGLFILELVDEVILILSFMPITYEVYGFLLLNRLRLGFGIFVVFVVDCMTFCVQLMYWYFELTMNVVLIL